MDPLTDRELSVLQFLPTMMTNGEIAADLYVSVNTVKAHLKRIFLKLEVTSKRQAVQRARGSACCPVDSRDLKRHMDVTHGDDPADTVSATPRSVPPGKASRRSLSDHGTITGAFVTSSVPMEGVTSRFGAPSWSRTTATSAS